MKVDGDEVVGLDWLAFGWREGLGEKEDLGGGVGGREKFNKRMRASEVDKQGRRNTVERRAEAQKQKSKAKHPVSNPGKLAWRLAAGDG